MSSQFLRLETHCQIEDSDLNKPGLAMIPESERREFVARCAENKKRYEDSICHNYRSTDRTGENAIECRQKGPFCLNEECGICESCAEAGYLCPNATEHDFGGKE